jgi:hypothetical protein
MRIISFNGRGNYNDLKVKTFCTKLSCRKQIKRDFQKTMGNEHGVLMLGKSHRSGIGWIKLLCTFPNQNITFLLGLGATLALKWEGELGATCTCFKVFHDGLIGSGGNVGSHDLVHIL